MLLIRYAAFYNADKSNEKYKAELALSLLTVELFLSPYIDTKIVIYTLSQYKPSFERLCLNYKVDIDVIDIDVRLGDRHIENANFAGSIVNSSEVDRICVVRMLTDFEILDKTAYRLLIGSDVFFLSVPQDVLSYVWGPSPDKKVLFMQDLYTFSGAEYSIRYYNPPILKSLLGDFYCLAPGVELRRDAITGCMKMIDAWPTVPSRYDPPIDSATTPEQHAAAILLYPFGGQALPSNRYSHVRYHKGLSVLHTHDIAAALNHLGDGVMRRFRTIMES
jgi:hypothetical protein